VDDHRGVAALGDGEEGGLARLLLEREREGEHVGGEVGTRRRLVQREDRHARAPALREEGSAVARQAAHDEDRAGGLRGRARRDERGLLVVDRRRDHGVGLASCGFRGGRESLAHRFSEAAERRRGGRQDECHVGAAGLQWLRRLRGRGA
jgi:hypothetical protein